MAANNGSSAKTLGQAVGVYSVLSSGLNAVTDYLAGSDNAKSNIDSLMREFDLVEEQKNILTGYFKNKRGAVTSRYGLEYKDLSVSTNLRNKGIQRDADVMRKRTGLKYSGTVEDKVSDTVSSSVNKFRTSSESLMQNYLSAKTDLTYQEKLKKNELSIRQESIKGQISTIKAEQDASAGDLVGDFISAAATAAMFLI